MNKDLHIITNESIFFEDGKYYCDNIDLKSIPEALNEQRNISIIGRKSKKRRSKKIDIKNIKINSNIFFYV